MVTRQSFETLFVIIFIFSLSLCSAPASSYDMPDMPDMSHMPNIPYMPHMYDPDMSKMPAMPRMNMPGMPRTGLRAVRTQSTAVETKSTSEDNIDSSSSEFGTGGESEIKVIEECWSHLSEIASCVNNILSAYSFRKFDEIGSVCCSAINTMTKDCQAKTLGSFHDQFFITSVSKQCSDF